MGTKFILELIQINIHPKIINLSDVGNLIILYKPLSKQ